MIVYVNAEATVEVTIPIEAGTTVSELEDDGIVGGKSGFLRRVRLRRCRKRQASQVRYRFKSQNLRQRQPEQMEEDISFGFPKFLTRDWITDGFGEVLRTAGFDES
jgi:hypothetical protein